MRIQHSKGFTLIELVVVIAIIGILAATALPRFVQMQRDARAAKINAIYGSIRSASALAKSRCELDHAALVASTTVNCKRDNKVFMDGQDVSMVYKYPTAQDVGIERAAQINLTSDGLEIPAGGAGGADPSATRVYQAIGATTPANCQVRYTAPQADGYAPVIAVDTSGC